MISHDLRARLGRAIEEYVSGHARTYGNMSSGVGDVKRFYYAVGGLLQDAGYMDDEILGVYRRTRGNYLLGKKYGLSPEVFASRIIDGRSGPTLSL